jgi:rare lipoprotein A
MVPSVHGLVFALSGLVQTAQAETMIASHYNARAPDIAAHRTLPMGTKLMITNPRTGRSVRVVIGTRGPFVRGRSLDISHKLAKDLGFGKSGVLPLETRVVQD